MNAIILAGGIPGQKDPLYLYTQGQPKALANIAGKPMIQWVLSALNRSSSIDHLLVVGLDKGSGLICNKPTYYIPDQGGMLDNIKVGLQHNYDTNPTSSHVLVSSCDIPAITPEIVDWRVQNSLNYEADLDYAAVTRKTMEAHFPGANRSYIKFKDYEVCGGDLNIVRVSILKKEYIWTRLIEARKNVFKQATMIGLDLLFLLLLGRSTLKEAESRVSKRIGIMGRVCLSPYAELAMDVDKPHQLELLHQHLIDK
jgi:molybdopterin-guanine dinucleotide biosynthesis protein A